MMSCLRERAMFSRPMDSAISTSSWTGLGLSSVRFIELRGWLRARPGDDRSSRSSPSVASRRRRPAVRPLPSRSRLPPPPTTAAAALPCWPVTRPGYRDSLSQVLRPGRRDSSDLRDRADLLRLRRAVLEQDQRRDAADAELGRRLRISSMLILATVTCPVYSVAISSRIGAIILQGPHHSAQKSSRTGCVGLEHVLIRTSRLWYGRCLVLTGMTSAGISAHGPGLVNAI